LKPHRIPGVVDVIHLADPTEIIEVNRDPRFDRQFNLHLPLLNWLIVKRVLAVLTFANHRFPTITSRDNASRAAAQAKLGQTLDAQADAIRQGPPELSALVAWLQNSNPVPDEQLGIAIQQVVGQLFSPTFKATPESWHAAKILVTAPRSPNILRTLWWFASGKLHRAKQLLAGMVNNDLSAVNGIGIGAHNIVNTMIQMKRLYSDPATKNSVSAEEAVRRSLAAPVSLLRQSTTSGAIRGCPFSKATLFILEIGQASKLPGGASLVFMDHSWSGCPAANGTPAMLEGVWKRATASVEAATQNLS
jgi:hypothetical protein